MNGVEYRLICGSLDVEVRNIIWDSRMVNKKDVFVAVIGRSDGTAYVENSIYFGVSAVIIDEHQSMYDDAELTSLASKKGTAVVEMKDSRIALALLAANKYGHPEKDLDLYGITGTKGKTTSAFMLHAMLKASGRRPGLMGTVCNMIGNKKVHTEHTTPEAPVTYEFLGKLVRSHYSSCVMEVSSLGLKLDREYGLHYKAACFTNIFRDHVGGIEHPTEEDYFQSKLLIFDTADYGIINSDCNRKDEVIAYASPRCKVVTYAINDESADLRAVDIRAEVKKDVSGSSFTLKVGGDEYAIFVPMPGIFNVYNALCALTCAYVSGIDLKLAAKALVGVRVPGRLQPVKNNLGIKVLVDYAHNGESLSSVIRAAREFTEGRVITLFGAGGDRPPERRFEMGRISGELSDLSIVTTDNPRSDDPIEIIDDIVHSVMAAGGKYLAYPDRKDAIEYAIRIAEPGDTVLLAGRGHEDYQEFKGVQIHLDDYEEAVRCLEEKEREMKGLDPDE